MIVADNFLNALNAPVRALKARVELTNGTTLEKICTCHDALQSFSIERTGEQGKFFGFGICQKLTTHFIDKDRTLNITKENVLNVAFGDDLDYIYPFPAFKAENISRDENTNAVTVVAYDALYKADALTVEDAAAGIYYTIEEFAAACAALLGLTLKLENITDDSFKTLYSTGANFEGTETIRAALTAIAEATQTIYYINSNLELVFKRLNKGGAAVLTIDREKYITLESGANRRLGTICHATELGDNVSASTAASGSTQYIRDNPFLELREDIAELLNNAIAAIGGITINQFECNWRGNYLLEIGDKLELITKDNEKVFSYLLDDTLTFSGAMEESTKWHYTNNDDETEDNPTTLGDVIKQTYARVDKANKEIELLASETSANTDNVAALLINTESINASVSKIEETTAAAIEDMSNEISVINSMVEAQITAEDVTIAIKTEIDNGVNKVVTNTGYTLDDVGLTIEKSGSEMKTQITDDGMTVYKNDEAQLTANNTGVNATNLHATTYLIIGNNSRFEDYLESRTGCFWIGE